MSGRDGQRARLYAWEDTVVAPRDSSLIAFAQAQGMVNAIWGEMELRYPPKVERLQTQTTARQADASHLTLRLPEQVPSWILLHELAHAMTSTHDEVSDGHGPLFVGLYVDLLVRYLRLERDGSLQSLATSGISVDADPQPVFVDQATQSRTWEGVHASGSRRR